MGGDLLISYILQDILLLGPIYVFCFILMVFFYQSLAHFPSFWLSLSCETVKLPNALSLSLPYDTHYRFSYLNSAINMTYIEHCLVLKFSPPS